MCLQAEGLSSYGGIRHQRPATLEAAPGLVAFIKIGVTTTFLTSPGPETAAWISIVHLHDSFLLSDHRYAPQIAPTATLVSAHVASAPPATPSVTSYSQNDQDNDDHKDQVASQVKSAAAEEQKQQEDDQ